MPFSAKLCCLLVCPLWISCIFVRLVCLGFCASVVGLCCCGTGTIRCPDKLFTYVSDIFTAGSRNSYTAVMECEGIRQVDQQKPQNRNKEGARVDALRDLPESSEEFKVNLVNDRAPEHRKSPFHELSSRSPTKVVSASQSSTRGCGAKLDSTVGTIIPMWNKKFSGN